MDAERWELVLSLFPGAGLLDRAFEAEGYCVVRGPDLWWGHDVRGWRPMRYSFAGIIGGTPCQDFSRARRSEPTGEGVELLAEFKRIVIEARPQWWLLENVPQVPDLRIGGYSWQRLNLNARECGLEQRRIRCFQFGCLDGCPIVPHRCPPSRAASQACAMASEHSRPGRRSFADFCALQGLPLVLSFPGMSRRAHYSLVGNGVPLPMGRAVAAAVRDREKNRFERLCLCMCGRRVQGKATFASAACRKRMERRRNLVSSDGPGSE